MISVAVLLATNIAVNQVGYSTNARKVAVVPATEATQFTVRRIQGGLVFGGMLSEPLTDPDSGDRIQLADFSSIRAEGIYEVEVRGVGTSRRFRIEADPYRDLLRSAIRSYFGQRCGTAVDLGNGYAHGVCHQDEGYHRTSGRSGTRPPSGGWHDAGDYGRYVVNSAITVGTLLWAWELFPRAFDGDLGIPESRNRTPDVLDEIRWNLNWMLTMQDEDGGVWHKLTPEEFPPFIAPEVDKSRSYVIGTGKRPFKSSCATAGFAAVMAIAARVYRPFDESFSAGARVAAERAWTWVSNYPGVIFVNPAGVTTGEYGDRDCRDERLWAAAELWRSFGHMAARKYVVENSDEALGAVSSLTPPSWSEVGPLAAWAYALSESEDTLGNRIRRRSIAAADEIARRASRNGYLIPLTTADYVWGSNGVAANYALQLLVANEFEPSSSYVTAALDVIHYLLGRNTFSLSWITGAGQDSVQRPHHRPSAADRNPAPWPGLLAGGPNRNRQDPAMKTLPPSLPPAKMYLDDQESYASNEVAINWNAPLVFVLAGLRSTKTR